MTGTPIENDLTNLWSLFDFLNKGLLGSSTEFRKYCKGLAQHPEGYAKLKSMVAPFMLRRVKTDKSIISDLPEKLEQVDYVNISKKQAVLYGIVARFDENPLLFFELRGIDVERFIDVTLGSRVEAMLKNADCVSGRIIQSDHWEELFGVL